MLLWFVILYLMISVGIGLFAATRVGQMHALSIVFDVLSACESVRLREEVNTSRQRVTHDGLSFFLKLGAGEAAKRCHGYS